MRRLALLAPVVALIAGSAAPAAPPVPVRPYENVCGWLANPTPANWWITDREREWTLQSQGGIGVPGWDNMTYDPAAHQYVRTNGDYGYGCACARLQLDHRRGVVLRIASLTARSLAACSSDRHLRHP